MNISSEIVTNSHSKEVKVTVEEDSKKITNTQMFELYISDQDAVSILTNKAVEDFNNKLILLKIEEIEELICVLPKQIKLINDLKYLLKSKKGIE